MPLEVKRRVSQPAHETEILAPGLRTYVRLKEKKKESRLGPTRFVAQSKLLPALPLESGGMRRVVDGCGAEKYEGHAKRFWLCSMFETA